MDVRRKTTASSSISSTPKYYGGAGAVKQNAFVPSSRLGSKDDKSPTTTAKIVPSTLYATDKLKKTRSISDKNIDNNPTATKAAAAKDQKVRGGGTDEPVWLQSLLAKDPSLSASSSSAIQQATEIWEQIQAVSIPHRRLSVSDNDLIHTLVQVTNNDPSVTQVVMMADHDPRVLYIEPALLLEVAEAMCGNTHVQKLVLTGMKLGNEFAAALATSLQVNCILEHVDISNNGFTNVKDFLKTALRPHRLSPLTHINIATQHAPVFKHEKLVALIKKHPNIRVVKADFDSSDAQAEIDSILQKRSQSSPSKVDYGSLVVGALEAELVRRKEIAAHAATGPIEIPKMELLEHEIPYFLDLEERSKRFQVRQDDDKASGATMQNPFLAPKASNKSLAQISASLFTGDGAFLTNEFIAKHLVEGPDRSLTFDFNNQSKLFRRFTKSDPARAKIVQRFVDTLVDHPKAASITHVNMANTLLDDDWLSYFCERCCKDPSLLLNLHCLNIESNTITDKGVQSLATGLAKPAWKFLQSIKLDNQKAPLSTETETELLHALAKNRTVIKLSLRVRNSCQRDQINLIMTRNIDLLRQARHFTKPSHAKRSRNKVEALFDCIALDDKTITSVSLIADKVFQSLHPQEKVKAASSFASNTHVTTIQMNGLQLDDAFAIELGKSLKVNKTIEAVDLESNALGSDGILALVESLETNRSIQTMKIRHQKKPLSSTDEGKVAEFIKDNQVVVSLGLDPLRNPLAKMTVERKISSNQDLKRRSKARK
jgi:Ran GTPase-activating protein (RanGAP) involved in mRNA processing and transport